MKNIDKYYIHNKETPTNEYNIPVNKGNEACVYLKYIIDNYDDLADFTFFIHDDEYAWHHSGSIISLFDQAVNDIIDRFIIIFKFNLFPREKQITKLILKFSYHKL